jgi:hypothetical protein
MRLRVKASSHIDAAGNVYKKGEVFVTDVDLREKVPNKFELLEEAPASKVRTIQNVVSDDDDDDDDDEDLNVRDDDTEAEPTTKKGKEKQAKKKAQKGAEKGDKKKEKKATKPDDADNLGRGEDVTDAFPSAGEADLKVFQHEGEWSVWDYETPVAKGLTSSTAVEEIIASYE